MKKVLRLSTYVLLLFFIAIVGCKKEEPVIDNNIEKLPTSVHSLKVDRDGVIMFKSKDDYQKLTKEILEMNFENKAAWEKSIGLETYLSFVSNIMKEIDCAGSEEEMEDIVYVNSESVEINDLEDGSRSIDFVLPPSHFMSYANSDGCFIIGDTIYKVGKTNVIYCHIDNKSILLSTSVKEIDNSVDNDRFRVFNYLAGDIMSKRDEPNDNECGFYRAKNYYQNSDRRLEVDLTLTLNAVNDLYVNTRVYPKKKNVWGNWVNYETVMEFDDYNIKVSYWDSRGVRQWKEAKVYSRFGGEKYVLEMPEFIVNNISPNGYNYFSKVSNFSASSRGIGDNRVRISCEVSY